MQKSSRGLSVRYGVMLCVSGGPWALWFDKLVRRFIVCFARVCGRRQTRRLWKALVRGGAVVEPQNLRVVGEVPTGDRPDASDR